MMSKVVFLAISAVAVASAAPSDVALDGEMWASIIARCPEVPEAQTKAVDALKIEARAAKDWLNTVLSKLDEAAESILDVCNEDSGTFLLTEKLTFLQTSPEMDHSSRISVPMLSMRKNTGRPPSLVKSSTLAAVISDGVTDLGEEPLPVLAGFVGRVLNDEETALPPANHHPCTLSPATCEGDDMDKSEWPDKLQPIAASIGCNLVSGKIATCVEDLASNKKIQRLFPGVQGTLEAVCCATCTAFDISCHYIEEEQDKETTAARLTMTRDITMDTTT